MRVSCDVYMEAVQTGGVFIAARVDKGGGVIRSTRGIFFWVYADGTYKITNDLSKQLNNNCIFFSLYCTLDQAKVKNSMFHFTGGLTVLAKGLSGTRAGVWYTLTLTVKVCQNYV